MVPRAFLIPGIESRARGLGSAPLLVLELAMEQARLHARVGAVHRVGKRCGASDRVLRHRRLHQPTVFRREDGEGWVVHVVQGHGHCRLGAGPPPVIRMSGGRIALYELAVVLRRNPVHLAGFGHDGERPKYAIGLFAAQGVEPRRARPHRADNREPRGYVAEHSFDDRKRRALALVGVAGVLLNNLG